MKVPSAIIVPVTYLPPDLLAAVRAGEVVELADDDNKLVAVLQPV